jgi:hypothetical protein
MITSSTFGTIGSFAANSLLIAGFVQSLAWLPEHRGPAASPLTVYNLDIRPAPSSLFQPFIDNPMSDADRGPRCGAAGPQGTTFYVKEAPLPAGFNSYPNGRPAQFACVRVDRHGTIREVRLPQGKDPALAAMIQRWWRISPDCASAGKGGWQRIRLTRWQEF